MEDEDKSTPPDWLDRDSSMSWESNKVAAVYMRVSTSEQEEEGTIENQWIELKERILRDKVPLPRENIYEDNGWSGALIKRPELDRLRQDAREGKFNVLYIYDRGRLSRKLIHQEIILDDLRKNHVNIVELRGVSGESPEERMMGSMLGLFHEYERTKITDRLRLGKQRVVKENHGLLGYMPCYGYDLHRTDRARKQRAYFTVNEEQAKVVRHIFDLYLNGKGILEIRKQLRDEGIKAPRTKTGIWCHSTILHMLSNTTYIGEHYYNKHEAMEVKTPRKNKQYTRVANGSARKRPKEEWRRVEGVTPIVDKKVFDKVQVLLRRNAKFQPRNTKTHHYLLAGLIKCECGKNRTGDPAGTQAYYRCKDRESLEKRKCFSKGINVQVFDNQVWHTIRRLLTQPKLIEKFTEHLITNDKTDNDKELEHIRNKLKKLEEEYDLYVDIFGKGLISEAKLREKARQIKESKVSLELKEMEYQQLDLAKGDINPDKIAKNLSKVLVDDLPFEQKQKIIRTVVDEVIANPKEATIVGKIPIFDDKCFLALAKTNTKNFTLTNIGLKNSYIQKVQASSRG